MLKLITALFTFLDITTAQPGIQRDDHNCVIDGGYEWCESAQACQRPWELTCEETITTEFCKSSNVQMCRMMCTVPSCPEGQCAMRNDNCCGYICEDISIKETPCPKECPLPTPCPMPPMTQDCRYIPAISDNCGCTIGCATIDCSTHPKIQEGGTCGGFMPYGMAGICDDDLECVYTMGPMIADAPGTCQPLCSTTRDQWGNCIEAGCSSWFDGCNTCSIQNQICTEIACYDTRENAECRDDSRVVPSSVPNNCVTWYDGCNTCSALNGELHGCTLMMCLVHNDPYCQVFTSGELHIGEICYRLCEDGSQNLINRSNDCPKGTECSLDVRNQISIIGFDSCGVRSHTCNVITGH